ncbi:MAG TPA: M28 family peptidase, partial [Thermoanaerobaculia bacterium]|nr:M28 family peptidase [Thermoanaerobaculia bacterium]
MLTAIALLAAAVTLSDITPQRLAAHVRFLASDSLEGREAGTRGQKLAAEYLAAQYEAIGLRTQFQRFAIYRATPKSARLFVDGAAADADAYFLRGNPASATGDVVFVNQARAEDFAGVDVKGKWLLIDAGDTRYANALLAHAAGAAGVLEVRTGKPFAEEKARAERNAKRIGGVRLEPGHAIPPTFAISSALAGRIRAAGKVSVLAEIERDAPIETENVLAFLEGSDLKHEYVVIAAHYDHLGLDPALDGDQIYNGAADDASGTAATLELARAFANAKPRRSILFVNFSAEEKGVVGSRYYVTSDPVVPLERIAAMINLDGVGGIDPKHPTGSTNYAYITTADVPLHDLMSVNERVRAASGIELTDARGKGFSSDNLSFEAYQVPTLYYSTGLT